MRVAKLSLWNHWALALTASSPVVEASAEVIRDVVIIGGGTTGSFAATWLLDHGLSFAVVERRDTMGGHSQTIYDEEGHAIEYGNVFFEDTAIARDYFGRYGVDFSRLPAVNDPDHPIQFYNLATGEHAADFRPPPPGATFAALERWAEIVQREFPFLGEGYYLPDPLPEELLMPFIEFVKKNQLQDMLNVAFQVAQGFGDFLNLPTLYAAKILSPSLLRKVMNNEMLVIKQGNAELYRRTAAEFAEQHSEATLFLSSRPVNVNRKRDTEGYISVLVETASATTTRIRARELLVTIPPTQENLAPFLDLNSREEKVFSHLFCNYYWTGVLRDADLPAAEVQNCDPANPGGVPSLPGSYVFEATPSERIHSFWYGAPAGAENQTKDGVVGAVAGEMARLQGRADGEVELDVLAFGDFGDFGCMVKPDAIRRGFYRDMYALQGYRDTWWTGAAWHTHDASLLWDFTSKVLGNMTAELLMDESPDEVLEL